MVESMTDTERKLLAAWESGEDNAGLLLADWLEEQADERADGVRWLAENDRVCVFDEHASIPWTWWGEEHGIYDFNTKWEPCVLPEVVINRLHFGLSFAEFPDFPAAIYAAAEAWAAQRDEVTT